LVKSMPDPIPLFGPKDPLPRGPHGLSRAEVAESQRTRLMAAFTELMAERGYAGVRIGELVARAGVSRAAFYEHFADKEAILLDAYDRFAEGVARAVSPQVADGQPWSAFVDATLGGYIEVLERDPTAARAFIVEMDAAGPVARRRRREALHGFAALIARRHAEIRARDPSLGTLPDSAYLALAFAFRETVHDALLDLKGPSFRELAPGLAVLANAAVLGAAAAAGQ
jgi:AcrR family transcriptional regulator